MRVIRKRIPNEPRVLALGTFDGVHTGHSALLRTAGACASEAGIPLRVCTFDRHPLSVIRPEAAPPLLTTIPEKAVLLDLAGADEMQLIPFDRKTADLPPEAFLERLRNTARIHAVVAGWNYTFGKQGRGNAELLAEDGRKHGYQVLIEEPFLSEEGTAVSSSLVREHLEKGETAKAERLLGHAYTLTGRVTEEMTESVFRLLFPAVKALPADGEYRCMARFAGGDVLSTARFINSCRCAEVRLAGLEERPKGAMCRLVLL